MWLRCIVVTFQFKGKKPTNPAYPKELNTIGDHLRKTRLDRNLSQQDVAKIIKVTSDTINGWELNRYRPTAKSARLIISFLRYFPFTFEGQSLGKKLYYARLITGYTQKQVAELIGCDASNLRRIELDQRKPMTRICEKIQDFIGNAGVHFGQLSVRSLLIPNNN